MRCIPANRAQRRYILRLAVAMALYIITTSIAVRTFRHLPHTGALAYLVAILPAIPILAVLFIVVLYLSEEKDEFERAITVQSMLVAIGGTLACTTVWGFLEVFAGVHHLPAYQDFTIFWVFTGVATPLIRRRYR